MRKLFVTNNIDTLRSFTALLKAGNIVYKEEEIKEADWSKESYGDAHYVLWIYEENDFPKAKELHEEFLKNPTSPHLIQEEPSIPNTLFKDPGHHFIERKLKMRMSPEEKRLQPFSFSLTYFLILLSCFLLLASEFSRKNEDKIPEALRESVLNTSVVEKTLLFDYPEKYELEDKIVSLYGYEALLKHQEIPKAGRVLYETYLETPSWNGFYLALIGKAAPEQKKPSLFEKIGQGEVWRLVSPIFLHGNILHLFFNMMWLFFLGTQIEAHIGKMRYLLFVVLVATISNCAQYMVSGPNFIGFSGVVCGAIFFIHARQQSAPWEGYVLSRSAFQFVSFFIFIMALYSGIGFVFDFFNLKSLPGVVANTAHLIGALSGYILGKINFFSWRITR